MLRLSLLSAARKRAAACESVVGMRACDALAAALQALDQLRPLIRILREELQRRLDEAPHVVLQVLDVGGWAGG